MPMRTGAEMPPLGGATEWLNATAAHAEAEARSHPTLVHFWSVGSAACERSLPRVAELRERRAGEGLRVVAVHTPRDEAGADAEAVRDAVAEHRIEEPCAVDNEGALGTAFQMEPGGVPAYYLFDAGGRLRAFASGEGGLEEIMPEVERVLARPGAGEVPAGA